MALLTQTATQQTQTLRESVGSLIQVILPLTTGSTSDTFQLGTGLPVVYAELIGNSIVAGQSYAGDAVYSSTTGLVTLTSAYYGSVYVILWMRT
jgi:hypothetical protein